MTHLTLASNESQAAKKINTAHKMATKVKKALRPSTADFVLDRKAAVSCTVIKLSVMTDCRPRTTLCTVYEWFHKAQKYDMLHSRCDPRQ